MKNTKTKSKAIQPVIKWMGGKRSLLPLVKYHFPEKFNAYYEPFLGGGAIAFSMSVATKKVLDDCNQDLVNFYWVLKTRPDDLYERLTVAEQLNCSEQYLKIRDVDRIWNWREVLTPVEQAARFIYLNKTSFNGVWRCNKDGYHNVGYSNPKNLKFDLRSLEALSQYLNYNTDGSFQGRNYVETTATASAGDLVYLDPPYDIWEGKPQVNYGQGILCQIALRDQFNDLVSRGCYVVLSNAATPRILDLYRGCDITFVDARRCVACNGDRTVAKEVIIVGNKGKTL